jgi:hypothetical protein
MAWLGYKRRTDLETALRGLKIPYGYGKGGVVVTTVSAVDRALVGTADTIHTDAIQF